MTTAQQRCPKSRQHPVQSHRRQVAVGGVRDAGVTFSVILAFSSSKRQKKSSLFPCRINVGEARRTILQRAMPPLPCLPRHLNGHASHTGKSEVVPQCSLLLKQKWKIKPMSHMTGRTGIPFSAATTPARPLHPSQERHAHAHAHVSLTSPGYLLVIKYYLRCINPANSY